MSRLVGALGPELGILCEAPLAEVNRIGGSLLGEAVARLRRGEVIKDPGYDGEYGSIRLFRQGELDAAGALFDLPARAGGAGAASPSGAADASYSGAAHPRLDPPGMGDGRAIVVRQEKSVRQQKQKVSPAGSLLDGLDPDQRAAATAGGPLMIIAGPGTGKTRTLTYRIAAAITQRGAAPESCLAITFTRRAAGEMRERLAALMPRQATRLTVTTFHGLGLMILREQHERAGLSADFGVADEKARQAVAEELAGSPRSGRALLTEAASDLARRDLLRKALVARDLVDFDGLVELPVTLLRDEPSIAAALRARWPHISVDEYQDIDAMQYFLLRLLSAGPGARPAGIPREAGPGRAGPGRAGPDEQPPAFSGGDAAGLTVIGDPDQAIYGFRGADVGYFLHFAEDYPGATTTRLTRNYRSSPAIVAGALQAIAPSTLVPGRVLRAMATAPPPAANSDRSDHDGGESAPHAAGNPLRSWNRAAAPAIAFHEAADEHGEAAWIAEAIDRLLGGSSFHSLDSGRADGHGHGGIGLADIAVLYRIDAQAGPLGQALTRAGLPFQKSSHDLLERRTGVSEIVRQMHLLDGGLGTADDGTAGARAAASGTAGARAAASGTSVVDRLRAGVARLASCGSGAAAVDIRAAGEVLAPLARRCGDDMQRFLTEISLGAEVDALDPRADAISLLTLHAAKGLEFGVVFVAGCEKDLLPLWLPGGGNGAGPDRAEERRLLFVGMTRAHTHLFLTCAAKRRRRGAIVAAGPSPFLTAIDPALLDRTAPPRPRPPAGRQLRLL